MTKILVIEDEPLVLEGTLDLLEMEGFEVQGAYNGALGLQVVPNFQPDVILCDIMMPEVDGYAVLESLRQNPATAHIPFVFLTAKASKEERQRGLDMGANSYLSKPFTADELLAAISEQILLN